MKTEELTVARDRVGWRPEKLREHRTAHGLTLEQAGERLREVAMQAKLRGVPAANPQSLWQHEQGEVFPGPLYQRAYCLLYGATPWELGFRNPLPHEATAQKTRPLTPHTDQVTGAHVQAVETALLQISPGGDVDHHQLRHRIIDAWRRRHTGGDPHRPQLVMVGGYAGSGKSELAGFLSFLTGWPILDKDSLTRPLVEALLVAHGGDPHDRHTSLYLERVRDAEYQCLMETAHENVRAGISTVLDAPFLREFADADWMQRLINRCKAYGVEVAVIWVQCDQESMREYISFRSAARDAWKLQNWDEYTSGIDPAFKPKVPHFTVDNRLGGAVSLTDQAKLTLARMYS